MEPINPEDALLASRLLRKAKTPAAKINDELADVGDRARDDLATAVEVRDVDDIPSLEDMYVDKRVWLRLTKVFAVSADLRDSTSLSTKDKYVNTSARLYEAATGSAVRVLGRFDPGFMDIQGDGMFALYHGDRALERAFCAAVSLKTFSERHLVPLIHELFSESFPETGFKLGMASGTLAVKKVGVRGTNEPVWAGKPVNWAAKCAQRADRHAASSSPRPSMTSSLTTSTSPIAADVKTTGLLYPFGMTSRSRSSTSTPPVGFCVQIGARYMAMNSARPSSMAYGTARTFSPDRQRNDIVAADVPSAAPQ